jgi:hypothetical protein
MPTTPSPDAFLEYNAGKLELRAGCVHLLPAGWAEYGPSFSAAGLMLRDKMPLEEFKLCMRRAARVAMNENDRALREQLADLATPVAEKQLIRAVLNPHGSTDADAPAAQVIAFPGARRPDHG